MNKLTLHIAHVAAGTGGVLWKYRPATDSGREVDSDKGIHVVRKQTLDITLRERGTL